MPFVDRANRRIHWTAEGEGPCVILVPGLGSGSKLFGTLPRRFARRGFRCVTFDPVGVPPSDPLGQEASFDDAAEDLLAVARTAADGGPYALVGTSLGGKVSMCAAATAPPDLSALILLASAARTSERARRVYGYFRTIAENLPGELLGPATAPFLFGRTFHEERTGVVDNIVRATRPDADAMRFMASQTKALEAFDGTALLQQIAVPTLCLAGAEDTLTDAADVEATANGIANADYRCIDKAGHSLLLEASEVFEHVAAFAAEHLPG